jgi:transcriptional regulator with XRE-family HTH domain
MDCIIAITKLLFGVSVDKYLKLFAERLAFFMEKEHRSVTDLYKLTGIGRATIHDYLNAESPVGLENLVSIAKALKVKPSQLLEEAPGIDPVQDFLRSLKNVSDFFDKYASPEEQLQFFSDAVSKRLKTPPK